MEARVRCALSAAMRHFCSDASVDATLTIAAKTKLGFRCTYTHAHTCTHMHMQQLPCFICGEKEKRETVRQPLLESTLFAACHPLSRSQHTLSHSQQGHRQPFLHASVSVCVCVLASVTAMGNANGNGNANANGNGQINQLGASQRPLAAVRVTSFISASRLHQLAQGKQQEQQQQQGGHATEP